MLNQDDYTRYTDDSLIPEYSPASSVGILEHPTRKPSPEWVEQEQPPHPPTEPPASPVPPSKRPGNQWALILLSVLLIIIFGVGAFAGWQFASTKTARSSQTTISSVSSSLPQTQIEAAIAKVEPAVVEIDVTTAQGEQVGSGVIIDAQGDIVTNNHVISGARSIVVLLSNGKSEQGQLIGSDSANDLAVVRI